jgi:diacylglycerol kinase
MKNSFSLKKLGKSFFNAYSGFKIAYRQQNFRLMLCLGLIAVLLGFSFKISYLEWLILILIVGLVLSLEILNSFFEELLDILEPTYSRKIKVIKDLSAAAVLMVSLTALILGIIIFGLRFFKNF